MKNLLRSAVETIILVLLAGGMLVGGIVAARWISDDEKVQYFLIGYYAAVHHGLVLWVWKKLRVEELWHNNNSPE